MFYFNIPSQEISNLQKNLFYVATLEDTAKNLRIRIRNPLYGSKDPDL